MNIFRKINGILKFIIFLRYNLEIVLERGLIDCCGYDYE